MLFAKVGVDFQNQEDRLLIMIMAMKCADVSNPAKSLTNHKQWASKVMQEFFLQGDEEKSRNLPVSVFMDRNQDQTAKCQLGFIDYIVLPMFEAWDVYMNENDLLPCMQMLHLNRGYWERYQSVNQVKCQQLNKKMIVPII